MPATRVAARRWHRSFIRKLISTVVPGGQAQRHAKGCFRATRRSTTIAGSSHLPQAGRNHLHRLTGEHIAVARVKLRVGNTLYTDVLSFMELDEKWAVIAKVLSGVPIES